MKTKTPTRRRLAALFLAALMCIMSVPMLAISAFAAEDDILAIIDKDGASQGTYLSFKAAIDAAKDKKLDNYTLRLLKDITTDAQIDINTDKAVTWTLDGNGKTITNKTADVTAIKFGGNVEAKVTIKNLNIDSAQCAILLDNGYYTIVNGTYTVTDTNSPAGSENWATGVVNCNPVDTEDGNTKVVNLTILGGAFMSRYLTEIEGATNKIQAVVRNNTKGNVRSTVNIYAGYFVSESTMTTPGVFNDTVVYTAADSGAAETNIYGGTFEARNAGYVLTANAYGVVNIYNGIFLADVYNYVRTKDADNNPFEGISYNNNNVVNISTANKSEVTCTYGVFSGGNGIFRLKGKLNGLTSNDLTDTSKNTMGVKTGYTTKATAPTPSLEAVTFDGKSYTPDMTTGVAMLLGTDEGGLKYETKVSAATIANIKAMADEGTELSYGTVITDSDMRYITVDALVANGDGYVDIKANESKELDTDGNLTFSGALVHIKAEYFDTEFTAISYVEAIIDGAKVRFYGVYNGTDNCMSVSDVAAAAVADVVNASEGEYTNLLENGTYSKYTQEEVTKLNTFIK